MTQWLIEEAAFAALEQADALAGRMSVEADERQARLRAMAERQLGR